MICFKHLGFAKLLQVAFAFIGGIWQENILGRVKEKLEYVLIISPADICAGLHCIQFTTSHLSAGVNLKGEDLKTFSFSVLLKICRKTFFFFGLVSICKIKLLGMVTDST